MKETLSDRLDGGSHSKENPQYFGAEEIPETYIHTLGK